MYILNSGESVYLASVVVVCWLTSCPTASIMKASFCLDGPMPRSTDLMAALMASLVCGDTSSLSCLECSCVALEKYASGDLYFPAFSDAPTALTFVGVTGSGAKSHAEQYLHQVFHSACLGFLEELAYSSLSSSAKAADLDEADAAADIPLANEPLTDVQHWEIRPSCRSSTRFDSSGRCCRGLWYVCGSCECRDGCGRRCVCNC